MIEVLSRFKAWFNSLPDKVQITVYSGFSLLLSKLSLDLTINKPIDWREYLLIPVGVTINLVAYQLANIKGKPTTEEEFQKFDEPAGDIQ